MSETGEPYQTPRRRARQARILAACRSMLDRAGYDGLTMRGLAREAGVAPATLYNLYGSKDGLVLAAVDDLLAERSRRFATTANADPLEAVLVLADATSEQIRRLPSYSRAMARIMFTTEAEDPLVPVLYARSYPLLAEQIERARTAGALAADIDADLIARHLTGQRWGVVLMWLMGMIPLDAIDAEMRRCQLMILVAVTRGGARERMEHCLAELPPPARDEAPTGTLGGR